MSSLITGRGDKDITGLLVIDPYSDFISEGGKVWDRIKGVAEDALFFGPDGVLRGPGPSQSRVRPSARSRERSMGITYIFFGLPRRQTRNSRRKYSNATLHREDPAEEWMDMTSGRHLTFCDTVSRPRLDTVDSDDPPAIAQHALFSAPLGRAIRLARSVHFS